MAKSKPDSEAAVVRNKKAHFSFELLDKVESGMVLQGTEVKSIRQGRCSLEESFVRIHDDHADIVNMNIAEYAHGNIHNHDPIRPRRLLLHKRQLRKIRQAIAEKGLTVIPLRLYFNERGIAKLEIAVARGKKTHDKRADVKKRDTDRELRRAIKRFV